MDDPYEVTYLLPICPQLIKDEFIHRGEAMMLRSFLRAHYHDYDANAHQKLSTFATNVWKISIDHKFIDAALKHVYVKGEKPKISEDSAQQSAPSKRQKKEDESNDDRSSSKIESAKSSNPKETLLSKFNYSKPATV